MHCELAAQRRRQRRRVLDHHEVKVERDPAEQKIAHGAADQVHPRAVVEPGQQRPGRGQPPDLVQQLAWPAKKLRHNHSFFPRAWGRDPAG